jgi:hypothetical protein
VIFFFFYDTRGGILVFVFFLIALLIALRAVMWMFALGRFAGPPKTASSLGYVIADFFVKLIDDFRHLLALFLVAIFVAVLAYALLKVNGGADEINKALQAVMATVGGLIGSIVGYYFGEESAARKAQAGKIQPTPPSGPQPQPDTAPITPVSDEDTSATPQGPNP